MPEIEVTKFLATDESLQAVVTKLNNINSSIQALVPSEDLLKPWATASDDEISAMLSAYYSGQITLNDIRSVWSVGDSRKITLSSMSATGVGEAHRSQTVDMVIIDFDHDPLTTTIGSKTKALITIQQKDCLMAAGIDDSNGSTNSEHGYMNSSNTNVNGWRGCARRTWCNEVYYNAIPSPFRDLIKKVNKQTTVGNQGTSLETTADWIFLPSEWEIFGAKTYAAAQEGTQYDYYLTATNRYKSPHWTSAYVSDSWWERSPNGSDTTLFCYVYHNGGANNNFASVASGLAPAYCL